MTDQNEDNQSFHDESDEHDEIETAETISPEDLIDELEKASIETDELHNNFADALTKTGFAKETIDRTKEHVINLIQSTEDPRIYQPVINTLSQEVIAYRQEVKQVTIDTSPTFLKVNGLASTAYSMATSSGSLVDGIYPVHEEDLFVPYQFKPKSEEIKTALKEIDPALFDIFQEIQEIFYNTKADNIKMALAATRQTFDHFFHILAPDDDVRASNYWKPKINTEKPNQIYRVERVQYAIATHIKDAYRAKTLLASGRHIIATYKVLNKLHTRGKVNLNATKKAIYTIVHFLEEVALAMEK